ncbi:MAG TPA: hypothetical protein VMP12_11015 [Candidatus Sulfotelmatobacter sp.]|nr:hypothetical protein [Candidatus Sulfotelmatobacter sp.]
MGDAGPLANEIEQHGALAIVHFGGIQAFGSDFLAVLAWTEDEIGRE